MFHVERLVHAASDLDAQVFVNSVFRNIHFVPLGELFIASQCNRKRRIREMGKNAMTMNVRSSHEKVNKKKKKKKKSSS